MNPTREQAILKIKTAVGAHEYQVPTLHVMIGICGSHIHAATHATRLQQLGLSHGTICSLMSKIHEHSVTCLLTSKDCIRKNNTEPS